MTSSTSGTRITSLVMPTALYVNRHPWDAMRFPIMGLNMVPPILDPTMAMLITSPLFFLNQLVISTLTGIIVEPHSKNPIQAAVT